MACLPALAIGVLAIGAHKERRAPAGDRGRGGSVQVAIADAAANPPGAVWLSQSTHRLCERGHPRRLCERPLRGYSHQLGMPAGIPSAHGLAVPLR